MDFEFTTDQLELRDNARAVLSSACPPSLVRSVFDGEAGASVEGLWKTLVDLGWPAIGVDEANGGLGLTFVETGLVVEELGRVVAPSPFVATVTQFAALARECGADGDWLARVADGTLTGTIAVDGDVRARRVDGGWVLGGAVRTVMDGDRADEIAVVALTEDGPGVFCVERGVCVVTPRATIDPTTPVAGIGFDGVGVSGERVWVEPGRPDAATAIERAMGEAITAMALSTVATCRAIFEVTLDYAKVREQFGKPIGSFQALKHRFANMYLAVEKASSLAYFAALTIAEDDERRSTMPSMAKACASDCQRLVVTDGLQLHGGIGFTWENDLHFWLKRAKATEVMFGSGRQHRARLARQMGLSSASSAGGRVS
jgi:alkylation response protein AidB-like acyl-CoA dehydrogenase